MAWHGWQRWQAQTATEQNASGVTRMARNGKVRCLVVVVEFCPLQSLLSKLRTHHRLQTTDYRLQATG